jgi:ATP-dependent DNA helicase RecG
MNPVPVETLIRWASQQEGQFFERKSACDRSSGTWRHRKATDIARDVVATLSAMANADGGEMVIGIEDNGDVSGAPHPADKRELIRSAPTSQDYVKPLLRARGEEMMTSDGKVLLHFQVDWSPEVHQLTDGRYLLRVGDANQPFDATQIAALKQTKGQGLWERSFPPGATLDDVDLDLVRSLSERLQPGASAEDTLRAYRLVENRNGRLAPNLAGLLLFGKDPLRWHPRCGIDFVRWDGVERRHGAELNIVKRIPIEFPLAVLPERAYAAIQPFIRERHTQQGYITNQDIRQTLGVSPQAAFRISQRLVRDGWLKSVGQKRWVRYVSAR